MSSDDDVSSRHKALATYSRTVEPGGPEVVLYQPRVAPPSVQALVHRVKPGDRLDLIAQRYYGDPFQYWRIVDANQGFAPDELLEPGTTLVIPKGG